jgi:Fe2+ transport system protein FeoA
MYIEVEFTLEIMRTKFAEMGFVPDDRIGVPYPVETGPTGEQRVNCWRYVLNIL